MRGKDPPQRTEPKQFCLRVAFPTPLHHNLQLFRDFVIVRGQHVSQSGEGSHLDDVTQTERSRTILGNTLYNGEQHVSKVGCIRISLRCIFFDPELAVVLRDGASDV